MSSYNEKTYWEGRYFNSFHSGEGSRGIELEQKLEFIRKYLTPKSHVLDLGHGDGELGFRLSTSLCRYSGFDISQTAVDLCRVRASAENLTHYTFECSDILDVKYQTADVVLCIDVLFHMSSGDKFESAIKHICSMISDCALISVWKPSIVAARKGSFAPHNNFFEFKEPAGFFVYDSLDLSSSPHKQILCLKRTPSVK